MLASGQSLTHTTVICTSAWLTGQAVDPSLTAKLNWSAPQYSAAGV